VSACSRRPMICFWAPTAPQLFVARATLKSSVEKSTNFKRCAPASLSHPGYGRPIFYTCGVGKVNELQSSVECIRFPASHFGAAV